MTAGRYGQVLDRWAEEGGRRAVRERCQDRCEGCGTHWNGQAAHRKRRSQGGLWSPTNILALCGSGTTGCHGLAHAHPLLAQGLGWEVGPLEEPADIAAWILTPNRVGAGWHLLAVEDDATGIRRHLVIPVQARWVA
jgi:hypothetical protein